MREEYNQFIGIYRDVFNKSFCDSLITFFDEYQENNVTHAEAGTKDQYVDPVLDHINVDTLLVAQYSLGLDDKW